MKTFANSETMMKCIIILHSRDCISWVYTVCKVKKNAILFLILIITLHTLKCTMDFPKFIVSNQAD